MPVHEYPILALKQAYLDAPPAVPPPYVGEAVERIL